MPNDVAELVDVPAQVVTFTLATRTILVADGMTDPALLPMAAIAAAGGTIVRMTARGYVASFVSAQAALKIGLMVARTTSEPYIHLVLHTGLLDSRRSPDADPTIYHARQIAALAVAPGVVWLTEETATLIRAELPAEVRLTEITGVRLLHRAHAESLFAAHPDRQIAPPRPGISLDDYPNNLPFCPTALLGRDADVSALQVILRRPDVRLVTLTGLGGTGKTRLSLNVASGLVADFADGVYFVALDTATDEAAVLSTLAQVLQVQESATLSLRESLIGRLRGKRTLLVLDNFEQVAHAAPLLNDLLDSIPGLKLLVSSRIALRLSRENEYGVSPLALPATHLRLSPEELLQSPAGALFVERACAVRSDFNLTADAAQTIGAICTRLDGLPLAIELAAARITLLTPRAILARLHNRLGLLTNGGSDLPQRQRTLRNTFAWSYDMLTPAEKRLLGRLAVFAGGCNLDAVELLSTAAGDVEQPVLDGVSSLIDKSLLRRQDASAGDSRYGMLETIREFVLEQVQTTPTADAIHRHHAVYYLYLAEQAEPQFTGPEQVVWYNRLSLEYPNMQAALQWAVSAGEWETAARTASALFLFWYTRGYLSEGSRWLTEVLEHRTDLPLAVQAKALNGAAFLTWQQGNRAYATDLYRESLAVYERLGDHDGAASVLNGLGIMATEQGDLVQAAVYLEQSLGLRRTLNHTRGIAVVLHNLGEVAHTQQDYALARQRYEECLAMFRELEANAGIGLCLTLSYLARATLAQGDAAQGWAYAIEGLSQAKTLGHKERMAYGLETIAGYGGADIAMARLFGAADALRQAIGVPVPANERAEYTRLFEAVQAMHAADEWAQHWAEGTSLDLEQAIAYALTHPTVR